MWRPPCKCLKNICIAIASFLSLYKMIIMPLNGIQSTCILFNFIQISLVFIPARSLSNCLEQKCQQSHPPSFYSQKHLLFPLVERPPDKDHWTREQIKRSWIAICISSNFWLIWVGQFINWYNSSNQAQFPKTILICNM